MVLFLYSLALLVSFYLLARICDEYFIESLDRISERFKLSHDVAGATLMAVGSSAPELFVAVIALIKPGAHAEIGMGTIVGSAIFNILVIIGAAAVVRKSVVAWQPIARDTIFYSLAIIILLMVFIDGHISVEEAVIFVAVYIAYLIVVFNWQKMVKHRSYDVIEEVEEAVEEQLRERRKGPWKTLLRPLDYLLDIIFPSPKHYYWVFLISIISIAGLSWVLVESAVGIATILSIPEAIIALTVLAIGTSVPDMISSMIVAKQGRGGMAISNAIGSNIFDILFGLGVPWLIMLAISGGTIPVSTESLWSSVILLFATVLVVFFLLLIRRWKIGRQGGYFLIGLYLVYIIWALSNL